MTRYTGRFAPSPTGPLHLGSLFAAVISYVDAKANQGSWLVRIEDLDPPREANGATQQILSSLEAHSLRSDQDIVFQSQRYSLYESALAKLDSQQQLYRCPCSRKELQENNGRHTPACQQGMLGDQDFALRFRAEQKTMEWLDRFQGPMSMRIRDDAVLKRKDGLYAYQLAVVVDDIAQNISHVVRGVDLIDSTPVQLCLYEALKAKPPSFAHFPVIEGKNGQKLSKQNLAKPLEDNAAVDNLRTIGLLMGQDMPDSCRTTSDMLAYLIDTYNVDRLKNSNNMTAPPPYT